MKRRGRHPGGPCAKVHAEGGHSRITKFLGGHSRSLQQRGPPGRGAAPGPLDDSMNRIVQEPGHYCREPAMTFHVGVVPDRLFEDGAYIEGALL